MLIIAASDEAEKKIIFPVAFTCEIVIGAFVEKCRVLSIIMLFGERERERER